MKMNKLVLAAAVALSLASVRPALADSPREESVMNQTGVYETTLKFFLHPRDSNGARSHRAARVKTYTLLKAGTFRFSHRPRPRPAFRDRALSAV
jgi:hypothetical protein